MKNLFLALFLMSTFVAKAQMKIPGKKYQQWPYGVSYEIFVRSFADSNGDGIGDLNGITAKLDYLKDLGIEAIWLTPICPSPTYHKYDVTDYKAIDPEYGTMEDFKQLVKEAHKLNIKIIPDLVPNHSSVKHPWFLEAKKGKDNTYRNYYVWSNSKHLKDSANWYYPKDENKKNIGDEKYYGFFWSGMPDLNYDNPKVREEMISIAKFWLEETDVDGFRLDAAQHIYDATEVQKNVAWWQEFRAALDPVKKNVYLVGEVMNKDTVVAKYLKNALSACFNFDLGIALQKSAKSEQALDLIDKVIRIRKLYLKNNPEFIDATILSNHDQNRVMDDLNGDINQASMAAALLLTLPGSPYLYYGEEIAMHGQKPDENIREPFLWDKGKSDKSQTSWMTARFTTDYTVTPAKQQMEDSTSFWHHYKSLLQFRAKNEFMRSGEIAKSKINNSNVCAFFRVWEGDSVLVIHNLSKKEVTFELPESELKYEDVEFMSAAKYLRTKNKIKLSPYSTVVLGERLPE
ncbi:MAG: alpha-glucosidase C-terminal domain-containing protein [Bacteroidetes bacterium]|nr:alpha-glucosidase C-terminal domain-containing protein [Bacteroidota bacterium]